MFGSPGGDSSAGIVTDFHLPFFSCVCVWGGGKGPVKRSEGIRSIFKNGVRFFFFFAKENALEFRLVFRTNTDVLFIPWRTNGLETKCLRKFLETIRSLKCTFLWLIINNYIALINRIVLRRRKLSIVFA